VVLSSLSGITLQPVRFIHAPAFSAELTG